jgi:hypothetical protein
MNVKPNEKYRLEALYRVCGLQLSAVEYIDKDGRRDNGETVIRGYRDKEA